MASPLAAQSQGPLSVIDWLGTQAAPQSTPQVIRPAALPKIDEPAVAKNALAPSVAVQPLTLGGAREIGLVPTRITGLPSDLWSGSDIAKLQAKIAKLPDLHLPAAQALLYTVLLSEAQAPGNNPAAGDLLALARAEKLMQRGALDPALSLIEQAGVTTSPAHFDLWMAISLLTGTEDRACDRLAAAPHLTQNYGTRIFCDARAHRWDNAALTLGTAKALKLLPDDQLALLERFLDPEGFDSMPPLPVPRQMDPLTFRLFETIGDPVNTAKLPRAYAVADLRDVSGWKAQLEAAERLTRAGALPDNRLLGLYSERKAAASGGVWDRVLALQRFETALNSGSADAVSKTLPTVWRSMRGAGLAVAFSELFADQLSQVALEGHAARISHEVMLLSPAYEVAAAQGNSADLASQIALGEVKPGRPADIIQGAIYDAFAGAAARADLVAMVKQGRLGESILEVLSLLHTGARGNDKALRDALATLRALGLEDTARRAALQTLLLEQ
jgi:hypothetical protein